MNRLLRVTTAVLVLLCAGVAQAQAPLDVPPGYWENVKSNKKAWIALNMGLAPDEEKRFWPIYDGYQKDIEPLIQLESRVRTVVRFELAQNIPLVGDTPKAQSNSPKR
jgi:hypothetical protein